MSQTQVWNADQSRQGPDQYFVGDNTEMWVYPLALTSAAPNPVQRALISAAGTLAAGTTTLTATTATTGRLYDKQRIVLPNSQVLVIDASAQAIDPLAGARYFPVGATALKIYANTAPLVVPASIPYIDLIPFYSVNELSFTADGEIKDFKNFCAGAFKNKKKTALDTKLNSNGYTTRVDPALTLIRQAAVTTGVTLFIRGIPPDNQGYEVKGEVASIKMEAKDGDPYMAPFDYAIGAPTFVNFTPS